MKVKCRWLDNFAFASLSSLIEKIQAVQKVEMFSYLRQLVEKKWF